MHENTLSRGPSDDRSARRTQHVAATAILVSTLIAAAAATATATATARATVVARSITGFEGGPALAADGRIVIGERRGDGARRIVAVDPATRKSRVLDTTGPLSDRETYPELTVTGTGGIVTAALSTFRRLPPPTSEEEQASPILLRSAIWTLLPQVVALGSCAPGVSGPPLLAAAAGTRFVATVGDECASSRPAVHLRTAAGALTIPARTGPADASFPPDIGMLRATGEYVAWVQTRLPPPPAQLERTLVVARGTTGEVLLRTPLDWFALMLGLGSDGTVVLMTTVSDFPCAVRIVSPAAPAPRRIALPRSLCANVDSQIAVGGGRFVYGSGGGYAVSDLGGSGHALAGANSALLRTHAVAFDGRTAYVVRTDCDADRLLAVDAGASGPPPSPHPALTKRPCPVSRRGSARRRVRAGGRVPIALRCPKGCRGTLRLVQQASRGRERIAARIDYASRAGNVSLRPKLARFARSRAGCRGGMRVAARLFPVGERSRGLGYYRITARSRCRRGGGPRFAAPRPGPRP